MYAGRYLLLGLPSAGLLGPLALAWILRLEKKEWKRAGLALLLALPLWLLALTRPYLWTAGLWLLAGLALHAWVAGRPEPRRCLPKAQPFVPPPGLLADRVSRDVQPARLC